MYSRTLVCPNNGIMDKILGGNQRPDMGEVRGSLRGRRNRGQALSDCPQRIPQPCRSDEAYKRVGVRKRLPPTDRCLREFRCDE